MYQDRAYYLGYSFIKRYSTTENEVAKHDHDDSHLHLGKCRRLIILTVGTKQYKLPYS